MIKKILSLYMSVYLITVGFAPIRTAHAQEKKIYTIGVMNLDAKGVPEVEAEVLSEKLRSHLTQTFSSAEYQQMEGKDQYEVVERENMDRIFEEFDIQNTGCVSDSCMIEFGKMLQADRILLGTVGKIGSTYSVSARILDIESSKTIATADKQGQVSIDDVMNTMIVEVGNELLLGKQKKSRKMWYIIGGLVIAGAGAGAAMMGGGGEEKGAPAPTPLPLPPGRPK